MNTTDDRNNKRGLIFFHIPKAAGTTLNQIIMDLYPKEAVYKIDGNRVDDSIAELKQRFEREGDGTRIRCVIGHMYFGLHAFMPFESDYITILREPVERIISHYYFVKRRPHHFLYEYVSSGKMGLKEYVESGISEELNNDQVRRLSGRDDLKEIYGESPLMDEALEMAKKNLKEHFTGIGLMERFDESLMLFSKIFGWKDLDYKKMNVSKERPPRKEVPADALEAIERYNLLDIELYDFAKGIFEEMLVNHGIGKRGGLLSRVFNR